MRTIITSLNILILLLCSSMLSIDEGSASVTIEVITVGVDEDFFSIQSAIDNASEGMRILVKDGTYFENFVVNKKGISIIGDGDCVIKSVGAPVISVESDNVTLMDLKIVGLNSHDIVRVRSNHCQLIDLDIKGNGSGTGLNIVTDRVHAYKVAVFDCTYGFSISSHTRKETGEIIISQKDGVTVYIGNRSGEFVECRAEKSQVAGFLIRKADFFQLESCIANNGSQGFVIDDSNGTEMHNCMAHSNNGTGLSCANIIGGYFNAIISNNGDNGMSFEKSDKFAVMGSKIERNGRDGIHLSDSGPWFLIENNVIGLNTGNGINCTLNGMSSRYWNINTNMIHANNGFGVLISPGSGSINITNNDFINNNNGSGQVWAGSICNLNHNYWGNWTSPDHDHDGIVDIPLGVLGGTGCLDEFPSKLRFWKPLGGKTEEPVAVEGVARGGLISITKFTGERFDFLEAEWFLDGEYVGTGETVEVDRPEGTYLMCLRYKDSNGNWSEMTREVRIEERNNLSNLDRFLIFTPIALTMVVTILFVTGLFIRKRKIERAYSSYHFMPVNEEKYANSKLSSTIDEAIDTRSKRESNRKKTYERLKSRFNAGEMDRSTYDELRSLIR